MAINIKVENFDGPFDLLLHLIKKNEMDIYNIKIYEITNQYMEYLNNMKEMDLEVTSEFILVAATLIEIKSKMLLPKEKVKEEEVAEEDPREKLIQRLIEYKKFKAAAMFFKIKKEEAGITFSKKPEIIDDKTDKINNDELFKNLTMLDLYNLYNELINRYRSKQNNENVIQKQIPMDRYRIEDKMEELRSKFKNIDILNFNQIISTCTHKLEVVVTFLALLELIKIKAVNVIQENNFKEIYVERILINEE
jgi:Uncharacterized conserved protein